MLAFTAAACRNRGLQDIPPGHYEINPAGTGQLLEIRFNRGESHNHPLMAIWAEDMEGNYIQTLYVARSIGTGIFEHGDPSSGKWMPGPIRRPAALPVWSHKRGIRAGDGLYVPDSTTAVPDAYTGATPAGNFIMAVRLDHRLEEKFRVLFEINQTWDWNEYWTNNKYPDNEAYKTSCQPALVYEAVIDPGQPGREYPMEVIGHSHYAGEDGEIYKDLTTMTTALKIVEEVVVKIREE